MQIFQQLLLEKIGECGIMLPMHWKALAQEQAALIAQQRQRIAELEAEVAALKKNSRNSSKPPSSDIVKPPQQHDRRRKRKIGGQKGHARNIRQPFPADQVNKVIEYTLHCCPKCKRTLTVSDESPKVFQQVDKADRGFIIVEHRLLAYWCAHCRTLHFAKLPSDIRKLGLFSAALISHCAYLKGRCAMSFATLRSYFLDVWSIDVSRGF
jgi:transposase